jgi:phage I-like protein
VCEDEHAQSIISAFTARKNPMVIDYDHQSFFAKERSGPAPAAGWIHALEWRPGKGLFAIGVKWTAKAKEVIQADEYRYISPVFSHEQDTGIVHSLFNVALVNNPAIDGMAAAVAHSLQIDNAPESLELAAMRQEISTARAMLSSLDDMKRQAYEEIAALSARKKKEEIEAVVMEYAALQKICPADRDAALKLASLDLDAFRRIMDSAPDAITRKASLPIVGGAYPIKKVPLLTLNEADLHMCQITGKSPEEFAALKELFCRDEDRL